MFETLHHVTRRLRRAAGRPAPAGRQKRSDRALARHFRQLFGRDLALADVQGLHFYAKNGVVTIYGTVRHELDRDLIVGFVRQTSGVEEVVSHLQIDA